MSSKAVMTLPASIKLNGDPFLIETAVIKNEFKPQVYSFFKTPIDSLPNIWEQRPNLKLTESSPKSRNEKPKRSLKQEFEPWMIEAARKHTEQGFSYGSFPGKHFVPIGLWQEWSRVVPELIELRELYNAQRIQVRKLYRQT